MTWTKFHKVSLAAAVLLAVVAGGVLYLFSTVDPGRVMALVANQVKAETGRDLKIRGSVSVSLFPQIAVVARQVSLSNPDWAADPDFIEAERLSIAIRWAPLLQQRVVIDNVSLTDAVLSLQAAPVGKRLKSNWVMAPVTVDATPATSGNALAIDLKQIELNRVQIRYRDDSGSIIRTAYVNRLNVVESDAQSRWQGDFNMNGLPISLTGQTTALSQIVADLGTRPTVIDIKLNTGLAGQSILLTGQANLVPDTPPTLDLKLQSQALDLKTLDGLVASETKTAQKTAQPAAAPSGVRVFSSAPIGFEALPAWQGKLGFDIKSLTLKNGLQLQQLTGGLSATAEPSGVLSSLVFAPLDFYLGQGKVAAQAEIRGLSLEQPAVRVSAYASGFVLGQIMSQLGEGKKLSGGATVIGLHLNSQGHSLSALAANADGEIQMSIGAATFSGTLFDTAGDFALSVLNAINPLRKSNDVTDLTCGVAYLPVQKGVIRINQTVGTRSDRLDASLNGTVRLGTETMDLTISTRERSGLTTGVNPADLVAITGSFKQPRLGINKTGVVKQAAGVGLAIVTGGVSLIAQNAASVVTRSSPCDNVLRPWPQVSGGLATQH